MLRKLEGTRLTLAIVFATILIGTTVYSIINWDDLTKTKKIIEYPDGCKELYINDVLAKNSGICEIGRKMIEHIDEPFNVPSEISSKWNLTN